MAGDPVPHFSDPLRRYRLAAGLTQEALAERAGLSSDAVSTLERGARQTPRKETLDLLARALRRGPVERERLGHREHPSPSAPFAEAATAATHGPTHGPAITMTCLAPSDGMPQRRSCRTLRVSSCRSVT